MGEVTEVFTDVKDSLFGDNMPFGVRLRNQKSPH